MIAKRKKTFCISMEPLVTVPINGHNLKQQDITIRYFTDSVHHSLTYQVPFSLLTNSDTMSESFQGTVNQIKMNFQFLLKQTKIHKKIFDNIGVINIKINNQILRYGILVTEEKGQIFVSLIE